MEQLEALNPIETKLSAARTRLILDKPFLGALVLRLPMVMGEPSWCRTTATDARSFYYNANFIDNLTLEETQFVLAHEALHCALSHFARRNHRIKMRWDLACDYAINPLLIKDGLKPPPNSMYMKEFEGMTAEEIYPLIDENSTDKPLDDHLYDDESKDGDNDTGKSDTPPPPDMAGGNGNPDQSNVSKTEGAVQPPPLSKAEQDTLTVQWQQRMAGAAQQAMQAGKLGGDMARMVDHLLQPQLPWRMLLAKYMNFVARDDYSYTRPSSRRGDPAIYPGIRSSQADIIVAVDTSGSISDGEVEEFVSEINAIKGQIRARITLLACDSVLAEACPWTYEAWDEFIMPSKIKGGGGTSFIPVFEWAEKQDSLPGILVYFTDAEGDFPKQEPLCPTIWLVKGKAKVPWGQRIQLN